MIVPIKIKNISKDERFKIPVSKLSFYSDDVWDFNVEIPNKNKKISSKKIFWHRIINEKESKLTKLQCDELIKSAKDFLYSCMSIRVKGNKTLKHISIIQYYRNLSIFVRWMAEEGYWQFSQIDKEVCEQYSKYLNGLPISDSHRGKLLNILVSLFELRHNLPDAINEHPFDYHTVGRLLGLTRARAVENKYERIPEEILVDLISKALEYIEMKSAPLLDIRDSAERIKREWSKIYKHPDSVRGKAAQYVNDRGFLTYLVFKRELRLLRAACYIIIATFSGMRNSEVLDIQEDCVQDMKTYDSDSFVYKISSTLYKTRDQPTTEYWIVPPVVVTAIDVLARLTASLRLESGLKELFLTKNSLGLIRVLTNSSLNDDLKDFIDYAGVIPYRGRKWHLHSHQFRYSFAYYMIKENRCHLKFLQKQFKHLSMDMTIWYAETTDEELKKDVYEMSVDVAREILKPIFLGREHLAGKGGEQIVQNRKAYFSGRTMLEKESLFEEMIKELYVRGTYLGLCIWNPEKATCNAGFECSCNPNICSNAIVTQEHLPIWLRLKERHEKLLAQKDLEPLKRQYIQNQMDTFVMPVLKSLGYKEGTCG